LGAAYRRARHGREFNAGPSLLHHHLAANDGESRAARANGVARAALGGRIEVPGDEVGIAAGRETAGARPNSPGMGRAKRVGPHRVVEAKLLLGTPPTAG